MAEHSLPPFPDVSYAEWRAQVEREMEGAPFDRLVAKTADGTRVEPLYTAEAPAPIECVAALPGAAPYTRHARALGRSFQAENRHEIRGPGIEDAVRVAALALRHGANGLSLVIARSGEESGLAIAAPREVGLVLEGLDLSNVTLAQDAGSRAFDFAPALLVRLEEATDAGAPRELSLGIDPLGALASGGTLPMPLARAWDVSAELVTRARAHADRVRVLGIHGWTYAEAGAPPFEELGLALAHAAETLRELVRRGIAVDDAAAAIEMRLAIGRDLFAEIAKLRAARTLFAAIVAECGGSPRAQRLRLHARGLFASKTTFDPWVNLLRGTTDTFAAMVGGAESVTTLPFDAALGVAEEQGERLAAHTPVILREESHLDRVVDPAGGSWYVESLTRAAAERAWSVLREIERNGGLTAQLRTGALRERLGQRARERARLHAQAKEPITGVTSYPDPREQPIERRDHAPLDAAAILAGSADVAPRLARVRFAEPFEEMRALSLAMRERTGSAPCVFVAAMGPPAQHRARVGFMRSFLAIAGVESRGAEPRADVAAAIGAFRASDARAAVICSTDETYPELVPDLARALKATGARAVIVAGRPGEHEEAWREAGVDFFAHLGCDGETLLKALLERLEVLS